MRDGTMVNVYFRPEGLVTFQETYTVGHGKYRRRELGRYRTVPYGPQDDLSDVLERAAAALRLSPLEARRQRA